MRWIPTAGVMPQPVPVAPPARAGARFAIAGAVVAFVGAVVIIVACVLPYVTITDNTVSQTTPSIFNPGYPGGLWFAVEPVVVAVVVMVAGVLLIAVRNSLMRAIATGALVGLGGQTVFLFAGYVGSSVAGPSERVGIGGFVGVIGALAILAAGGLAATSLGAERQSTAT